MTASPDETSAQEESSSAVLHQQLAATQRKLQDAERQLDSLRALLRNLQIQSAAALERVSALENSLSFRLGQTIARALKSWRGALALPASMVKLLSKTVSGDTSSVRPITRPEVSLESSKPRPYRALTILDEISEACWAQELQLDPLERTAFEQQIAHSNSGFAFLESCWNGNRGAWQYAFTSPGHRHANAQALQEAIRLLRERQMTIAFWNKEDPMHYDRFLPVAKEADIIFTTDANKVDDYRRDARFARVEVLPFAAQARLCNPSNRNRNHAWLCFAGSYYGVGHDDRKRQMDMLLPSIIEFNGTIYDRMSEIGSERYQYPDRYRPFIRTAVPFEEIRGIYKSYKVFLNVNTITDSPTMMARRVYELLACGTPVVSTPSRAIEEQFQGIVQVASTTAEANGIIGKLLSDQNHYDRISHLGYREVMQKHSYAKRLGILLPPLGIPFEEEVPLVSIVMCTMRPTMIERIVKNVTRQNHRRIEVIFILQGFSSEEKQRLDVALRKTPSNIERIEMISDDSDRTLGERFNHGALLARGAYIAKMDDDDLYFENYISDMLLPFAFGDYGLVGKREIFIYFEGSGQMARRFPNARHSNTDFVSGATFLMRRDVLEFAQFEQKGQGEDTAFLSRIRTLGYKIYAADPYNFVQWRAADWNQHTWRTADDEFLRSPSVVEEGDGLDLRLVQL
jgi:hypothetical protein